VTIGWNAKMTRADLKSRREVASEPASVSKCPSNPNRMSWTDSM